MSTKWERMRALAPAGAFVIALVAFVVGGIMLFATHAAHVDVDESVSGYVGPVVSDPKGQTVVVDIVDTTGDLIIDADGTPVRAAVNEYTFTPGDAITVYEGTGDIGSKYGTASTYRPVVFDYLWIAFALFMLAYMILGRRRIEAGLDRWEELVRADRRMLDHQTLEHS